MNYVCREQKSGLKKSADSPFNMLCYWELLDLGNLYMETGGGFPLDALIKPVEAKHFISISYEIRLQRVKDHLDQDFTG